jgi:hypothetical protein
VALGDGERARMDACKMERDMQRSLDFHRLAAKLKSYPAGNRPARAKRQPVTQRAADGHLVAGEPGGGNDPAAQKARL